MKLLVLPNKYSNLLANIKFAYISVYTLLMFLHHVVYASSITRTFIPFLLPLGALILAADVIFGKLKLGKTPVVFAICFLASYLITTIINGHDVFGNIKTTCWSAVQLLVSGSICAELGWDRLKQYLKTFCSVLSTLFLLTSGVSLYFFVMQKEFTVVSASIDTVWRGWHERRLWGIYEDPNHAAWFALFTILMCMWLFFQTDKKWKKGVLIGNICVQGLYFLCSNSRGGLVALSVAAFIYGLSKALNPISRANKKVLVRIIVCTILVLTLLLPVRYVAQRALAYVPAVAMAIVNNDTDIVVPEITRIPYEKGSDVSANRISRWVVGIKTMLKANALFGIGDRNIAEYVTEYYPNECPIVDATGCIHGSVAKLLTSSGFVGTMCIFLYMLSYVVLVLKTLISKKLDAEKRVLLELCLVTVCAGFASSVFLEEVFLVNNSISCTVFYCAIAIGVYIASTAQRAVLPTVDANDIMCNEPSKTDVN